MDIGALLKSQSPLPWNGLPVAITEESKPPLPADCSLAVLSSRDLRLLFFTDRSTRPDLCLGSPIEPWRWWHVDTIADALDQPSPSLDPDADPTSQLRRLVAFVTSNYPALTNLLGRKHYRANRAPLRAIEQQQAIESAQRLGLLMKPDDPRRKWYSLRTLGGPASVRRVG